MAFWWKSRWDDEEVIGSAAPEAFYLGRYWYEESGFKRPRIGPKMQMPSCEPIVVIGRNRSGKDAGIGNYNALQLGGNASWFMYDPRGEGAAVTALYRRQLGPTAIINPDNVHAHRPGYGDLRSVGRNPLEAVDWGDKFFDQVARIVAAWLRLPPHGDLHWMEGGRQVVHALAMFEIQRAAIEGRPPSVHNIRMMLTEANQFDPKTREPVAGFAATAVRIINEAGPQAASLISRFVEANDETQGVKATADTATQWMLSPIMARDMSVRGGADFRQLGKKPSSYYYVLPHEMCETHSALVREALASALATLYDPTNTVPCTFWLNEFATLGRSEAVENALGLVAGSGAGIRLCFVVQSLTQLARHYGEKDWENFMGQAGAVILIGPPADKFTAEYLSSRSGEKTILSPNASMSLNAGGAAGMSSGEAFTRINYLLPQDLYALQPGFGYVWVAGLSNAIPSYFPPYFDVDLLRQRARANPLYKG
jgi:type IV secretory pathway TraG/TraD family ATPase VirD4